MQAKRENWWLRISELREPAAPRNMEMLTPRLVIEKARAYAGPDALVATDVGQHQMWTAQYYSFSKPRRFLTSGGLGTMGFGMGAAIGGCVGTGGRRTVLFTGDGSFHMNLNELATAVTEGLPLTVVILNNGVLGMVRQWQTLFFEKRYAGTTLNRRTDFVKLAEAFGARGFLVERPEELDDVFKSAFEGNGVSVIDCRIGPDEMVFPMIPPNGSIRDIICS
jgi:acetolactate synthase-1/2/3 large subunit